MADIGGWSPDELRRFVVNTILTDPGALPKTASLPKPVADGDVPVWDQGSNAWVSSQKKAIEGRELAWHTGSSPPLQPVPGDLWLYTPPGTAWLMQYDPATDASYPWQFISGNPGTATDANDVGTPPYWIGFGSGNPTIPRDGRYQLSFGDNVGYPGINAGTTVYWDCGLGNGSGAFGDPWQIYTRFYTPINQFYMFCRSVSPLGAVATLGVGTVLQLNYQVVNWDIVSYNRWVNYTPSRLR